MLRAVDVQQALLQSSSVERVQQTQQQQPDMQQRYFEVQVGQEKKALREKVKDTDSSDRARIREEEEERQRRHAKGGRAKPEAPGPDAAEEDDGERDQGRRIDIRV